MAYMRARRLLLLVLWALTAPLVVLRWIPSLPRPVLLEKLRIARSAWGAYLFSKPACGALPQLCVERADWFRCPDLATLPSASRPLIEAMESPCLYVVDDFYPDPGRIRELALGLEYVPYTKSWFSSALYRLDGKVVDHPFEGFRHAPDGVREHLEQIVGRPVDRSTWETLGDRWNGAFHHSTSGRLPGFLLFPFGSAVHHHFKEGDVERGWSGLVYLSPNPPPASGTLIWRSRETGRCVARYGPLFDVDMDGWELAYRVENRFNRLVLFRCDVLHSAEAGFGDTRRDSRLFQTFFFNVLPS